MKTLKFLSILLLLGVLGCNNDSFKVKPTNDRIYYTLPENVKVIDFYGNYGYTRLVTRPMTERDSSETYEIMSLMEDPNVTVIIERKNPGTLKLK